MITKWCTVTLKRPNMTTNDSRLNTQEFIFVLETRKIKKCIVTIKRCILIIKRGIVAIYRCIVIVKRCIATTKGVF